MSHNSKIEWCDATWNVVAGCTKCSPGCLNCYAERMAWRLARMYRKYPVDTQLKKYHTVMRSGSARWNNKIYCDYSILDQPLHWRKPKRIFVCSMSDLFHEKVPRAFIAKVLDVACKGYIDRGHTSLFLTKRIKRMEAEFALWSHLRGNNMKGLYGFHLGVSISNQAEADEKIPILLQIPAAVRGLSIEPMLEGIDLPEMLPGHYWYDWEKGCLIDWVVVGGESGPGARPMHPDWVRNIRDQCVAAGVSFYFKQWGEWGIAEPILNDQKKRFRIIGSSEPLSPNTIFKIFPEHANSTIPLTGWVKVGKKKAGCILDGKTWKQLPERS